MNVRDLKTYPDPVLRKTADPVEVVDETTRTLILDMFKIMDEAGGIGLAAPQIGVSKRIIIVSVDKKNFERLALIDPVVEYASEDTDSMEEGCLSIPGVNAEVLRPLKVIVKGMTRSGRLVEITATHLLARVLQHEIDHLNGVLFIDRLSEEERERVKTHLNAPEVRVQAAHMPGTSVSRARMHGPHQLSENQTLL
jgi:peptide deformylase